jgi:hypothetical protein
MKLIVLLLAGLIIWLTVLGGIYWLNSPAALLGVLGGLGGGLLYLWTRGGKR